MRKLTVFQEHSIRAGVEVDDNYMELYGSFLTATLKFKSTWTIRYMLWLMRHIQAEGNRVDAGRRSAMEFRSYVQRHGHTPPSPRTVHNAIAELAEEGLIRVIDRGIYEISPRLFWQSSLEVVKENGKIQDDSNGRQRVVESPARAASS